MINTRYMESGSKVRVRGMDCGDGQLIAKGCEEDVMITALPFYKSRRGTSAYMRGCGGGLRSVKN